MEEKVSMSQIEQAEEGMKEDVRMGEGWDRWVKRWVSEKRWKTYVRKRGKLRDEWMRQQDGCSKQAHCGLTSDAPSKPREETKNYKTHAEAMQA